MVRKPKVTRNDWKREQQEFKARWLTDDCAVKECIDGLIIYEDRGYSTVARCGRCDRSDTAMAWGIPGLPRYTGSVTLRTEHEMTLRGQERREIVEEGHFRRLERGRQSIEKAKGEK